MYPRFHVARTSAARTCAARTCHFFLLLLVPLLLSASQAEASSPDWPQFRGPERDGKSPATGLLSEWPEGGPALVWRVGDLGGGYSSVSVAGDSIYTLGDVGRAQYVFRLKRADGSLVWRVKIGRAWKDKYRGPRSTPTVDGDRIFVLNTEGDLSCLDKKEGEEIWRCRLTKEYSGMMMKYRDRIDWKFSESPLVDGERVIVTPGVPDAALVALNKKTGKEIWKTSMPPFGEKGADGAGYSSVVVGQGAGVRQYVQLLGRGAIGVEANTGRFLWGYNRIANGTANIATPVVHGDSVFVSTGYDTGSALVSLASKGQEVEAAEDYFLQPKTMQNHHGGVILHEGYLYSGTGHNKGFPLCLELKTGKVAWGPIRNKGRDSAVISYADGHLYFRYQNGLMVLIEANPREYREKGSFMIPDVEMESWAQPVIAGDKLYLREQENLFCYDILANEG